MVDLTIVSQVVVGCTNSQPRSEVVKLESRRATRSLTEQEADLPTSRGFAIV